MSIHADVRSAYQGNAIATASPTQWVVRLYERLVLDVERGLRAQMRGDREEANSQLQHAQAIVTEFQSTLDVEGWAGGHELMALYGYIQRRLIAANVNHDLQAAKEALVLCRGLHDTWRRAATIAAQG
jgi:flagellar secretion chaperone FliS